MIMSYEIWNMNEIYEIWNMQKGNACNMKYGIWMKYMYMCNMKYEICEKEMLSYVIWNMLHGGLSTIMDVCTAAQ